MVKYTNIPVLKINKMSQERYDSMKEAGEIKSDELYITPGNESTIPTKVSELENDSGYLTSIPSEYVTESELNNILNTKLQVVTELPSSPDENTFYFVIG